jgi:hypothetical protein
MPAPAIGLLLVLLVWVALIGLLEIPILALPEVKSSLNSAWYPDPIALSLTTRALNPP